MTSKKIINASVFAILVPIVLENILVYSASAVSAAMVGRLTAIDISTQGICGRAISIYLALFKGFAIGLTITGALRFGEGNLKQWRKTIEQAFLTGVPVGLLICALVIAFPAWFIRLFTDDAEILRIGCTYLRLIAICFPFLAISAFVTSAFQSRNNTKVPMVIAGIVNVVNILLGWVLIFGKWGAPAMGLMGAGIALVVAYITGAVIGLFLLFNKKIGLAGDVRPDTKALALDRACIRDIYATGLPAAGENLQWQLSTIVLSRVILLYGVNSYAAYQLGLQSECVFDAFASGFIVASATLAATAIGKRDEQLYHGYFWQLVKICLVISIVVGGIILAWPQFLMRLFTNNEILVEIGVKYLVVITLVQVPQNLSKLLNGTIRAAGYKKTPLMITVVGIWGVRIPLCCLIGYVLKLDLTLIWWVICLDLVIRMLLSIIVMVRRRVLEVIRRMPPVEAGCPSGD